MSDRTPAEMRQRVLDWEAIIHDDSELYARLARCVANDQFLLDLIQATRPGQPEMNMLLAAVHYMLMAEPGHPLADWYQSLGGKRTDGDLEGAFVDLVMQHRDAIAKLIAVRLVQTNEVARCTFLLPAYNLVNKTTDLPIALIEVGTSAGLTQNIDRYGYCYDSTAGRVELAPESAVHLECSIGDHVPALATAIPEIVWRRGLDLNPVNVTDADEARWLQALIWPDQVKRHERLAAAIKVAQLHPPTVVGGDVFNTLPELVRAAPAEAALVVQHSWVLNQFSEQDRERLYTLLDDLAADRPVYRVGAEMLRKERGTVLDLTVHGSSPWTAELADVHHHGTWIKWHSG
ncbi:MAG: DUF2332 domain-containing protein [bacterium]|nr:DUF2332 domain-containing protein [bacterium]